MAEKQDKKPSKALYLLMLMPVFMFGLVGGFLGFLGDSSTFLSGFLGGLRAGVVILLVCGVGILSWEWIQKEASKGKLLPYILVGILVAVAISGYSAISLGSPTCIERDTEPMSTCTQYADDGHEATSEQKWEKFWGTLPVTVIITSLVAVIVRNEVRKNQE